MSRNYSYYDKKDSKVNIYYALKNKGWNCYGFKENQSDSYSDYYDPASWRGIAEKNGFVFCVDINHYDVNSYSGHKVFDYNSNINSNIDHEKIKKLEMMTIENGCTSGEAENAKQLINKILETAKDKQTEKENTKQLLYKYPEFMENPGKSTWHIEKDGKIIDKGNNFARFSDLPNNYDIETEKFTGSEFWHDGTKKELKEEEKKLIEQFKSFITRIDNIGNGCIVCGDGTEETEEEGIKAQSRIGYELKTITKIEKVLRMIKVERNYFQVGDYLKFNYHGGFWLITNSGMRTGTWKGIKEERNTFSYELVGSEKRKFQKLTHPKRYYQWENQIMKELENKTVEIFELKEVEEEVKTEKWVKIAKKNKKDITENQNINNQEVLKMDINTIESKIKKCEPITAKEIQDYYIYLRDNEAEVKNYIMNKINSSDKFKRKRQNTKNEIVKETYDNLKTNLVYCIQDTFSFEIKFDGTAEQTQKNTLEKILFNCTDEQIEIHRQKRIKAKQEHDNKMNEYITAMKNPETLEDFKKCFEFRKTPLTEIEQEKYDFLLSEYNKQQREEQKQQKKEEYLNKVNNTEIGEYIINEDIDTRDNSKLWVLKLINKVDYEIYKEIERKLKTYEGYYSRFKKGFIFRYDPTEKLNQNNNITAPEKELTQTEKLLQVADNMQNKIDYLKGERKTNTWKRAKEASNAWEQAESMERKQEIIRNIVTAIENKELKLIDKIDSKAQIDTLESILIKASNTMKHKENIDYNIWYNSPMKIDCVKYAEIPSNTIYKDILQRIIFDIKKTEGFILIGNRLQKLIDSNKTNDYIDITDYTEEFDKVYKNTDILKNQYFETAIEERKRLERMGITCNEELRAYLREYWNYRTPKKQVDPTQKKIRELETQYKLNQKGDINFTPKEIVLQMIELSGIDNNSIILEPSAGIGNIADEVKNITDNIDCCEQMNHFTELLKLKGFNVVGSDFLQYNKFNYYDCIIMNPPFSSEQEHIKHAYNLLKTGGKIISITSPHWTFASDRKSQDFKNWIENINGEVVEDLESGTFEMTGVRTKILLIEKKEETLQQVI